MERTEDSLEDSGTAEGGARRVLVLVGGGHAHVQVVLGLSRSATSSTTCVLLSDGELAAYSGMLPAVMAGLLQEERAHVNLRELAAHNGFLFVHAAVTGVDAARNEIRFRPCADLEAPECRMRFDFLSVNVGSRTVAIPDLASPRMEPLLGNEPTDDESLPMVICTRPILRLMSSMNRFEDAVRRCPSGEGLLKVVVVGGGAAGIELALAVQTRLSKTVGEVALLLVSKGESFADAFGRQAGNAVLAEMKKRRISYRFGTTAVAVNRQAGLLVMDNTPMIDFDLLIVATGAAPHPWLTNGTDLRVDKKGWLLVEPTLLCMGHSNIFGAGDCISFGERFGDDFPPKAGVYAVREGSILTHNIEAVLKNHNVSSLKRFVPQSSFLSLISTGDGRGIGSKYGLVFKGTWVYRLKSFIDESWQDKFRMPPPRASSKRTPSSSSAEVPLLFEGTSAEGAALLQAAEDVLVGDCFERQLSVLQRMDADVDFRRKLLKEVRKDS